MRTAISSAFILAFVALCGLDASPQPKPKSEAEVVAWMNDQIAPPAKLPCCDCVACKCDPCECSPVASPLVVGPPPDAVPVNGSPVTFTQPPAAKPKPVAAIARPQAVSYGSCGPGGCGTRGRIFGRRR